MQPAHLFSALQLADSFFPSGLFTQSHGIERFIEAGLHGDSLAPLVHAYLLHVAAPGDALAARWVARAAHAGDHATLVAIDTRLEATKLAAEGRLASRRCGRRVLLLGAQVFAEHTHSPAADLLRDYAAQAASGQVAGHQALALALCGAAAGLDETAVVASELHSFAVSLLSAALRLGALDHVAAQQLLFAARPVLAQAAELGVQRDWREIGSFAPTIELMQFLHPTGELHMFVS